MLCAISHNAHAQPIDLRAATAAFWRFCSRCELRTAARVWIASARLAAVPFGGVDKAAAAQTGVWGGVALPLLISICAGIYSTSGVCVCVDL